MATTITAATLTVTLTEEITHHGQDKGSPNALTVASVTEVSQRIVNIPVAEVIIIAMGASAVAAGQFVEADVRYIRLTNKDDTNYITLVFRSASNTECAHKLDAGQSFIYAGTAAGIVATHLASGSALGSPPTLVDLVDITAFANTAACDLEIFVAGD